MEAMPVQWHNSGIRIAPEGAWHGGAFMTFRSSLSAIALAGVTAVSAPLAAIPSATAEEAPAACGIADDSDLRAAGTETESGHYAYEEWMVNAAAQRAFERVGTALARRFGESSKTGRTQLDAGFLGLSFDHHARTVVAVVDTDLVSSSVVGAELKAAALGAFPIRVQAGCRGASELLAARRVLRERLWHSRARDVAYGFHLDSNDSTFHVSFSERDGDVAAALAEATGSAVTIDYAATQRDGRLNDGEAHWGGAGIGAGANNNFCTSGFTVVRSGVRGSVSAGHCFSNGQSVYSGPEFYGTTSGESGYPAYDMIRVGSSTETYDNRIHVDPCCPSVRDVTGRGNPAVGTSVCLSGMVTRAVCAVIVRRLDGELCDSSGDCTPDLIYSTKPGSVIRAPGDSGAPMYTRPTTSTATIRGMHIGGARTDESYAEKISNIEAHLGVTVATT
jgi:hypothetical protein